MTTAHLKKRNYAPLVIAAVLSLAGPAWAAGAPQVVGVAAAVVNDVSITSGSEAQPRRAVLRERVALADRVQTGARSRLQLILLDQSTFSVGANARLTIDRYVFDPARGGAVAASVAKGAFRFMSGRRTVPGGSAIRTPVATVGIRGTIVEGVVGADAIAIARREPSIGQTVESDPESATLIVLRGPGPRTQAGLTAGAVTVEAAGVSVLLDQPLLAVYVPGPGKKPIGPFALSLSGLARLNVLLMPGQGGVWRSPRNRSGMDMRIEMPRMGGGMYGN